MMKFKGKKSKSGFTLVELIIVMLIIGILSSIVIPQIEFVLIKAHQAKAKATLATARTCVNMAYTDKNEYLFKDMAGTTQSLAPFIVPKYIEKYPLPVLKDPSPVLNIGINGPYDAMAPTLLADGKDVYITNVPLDPDLGLIKAIYIYNNLDGTLIIADSNYDTSGNSYGAW